MPENDDAKQCKNCKKKLTHTTIKVTWSLDTLEGEVELQSYFYCVSCGTIRGNWRFEENEA